MALQRALTFAARLCGARQGAIVVYGPTGRVEHFAQVGFDDAVTPRVFADADATSFLTVLLGAPPARIAALVLDDAPAGVLAGHTGEQPFLCVPIESAVIVGSLFLAAPTGDSFSSEDAELALSIGAVAAGSLEDDRLRADLRRSAAWLAASGEIARTLLEDGDDDMLAHVIVQARELAVADYSALIVPREDGSLTVLQTDGLGAQDFQGLIFDPEDSALGRYIVTGKPVIVDGVLGFFAADFVNRHQYGPAMMVPLVDGDGVRGAMIFIRTIGRPPFLQREADQATTFAAQVALALQFDDARAEAEWTRALEDRHRIAQDLHDNVMQRLFATGMGLQTIAAMDLPDDARTRLHRCINDLDEIIDETRNRVFGLSVGGGRLRRSQTRFPHVSPALLAASADDEPDS